MFIHNLTSYTIREEKSFERTFGMYVPFCVELCYIKKEK